MYASRTKSIAPTLIIAKQLHQEKTHLRHERKNQSELRHKEKFGTRLFLAFTTWTKEEKILQIANLIVRL